MVLGTETPYKLFQRQLEPSSAIKPSAMDSIPGSINVADPDSLQAEEDVAVKFLAHSFQLAGKSDRRFGTQVRDRSKRPLGVGPVIRCNKLYVMSGFEYAPREAF
jgi:hypothetical protein